MKKPCLLFRVQDSSNDLIHVQYLYVHKYETELNANYIDGLIMVLFVFVFPNKRVVTFCHQ